MNGDIILEVIETMEYVRWFERLRDRAVQVRIAARIRRVSLGDLGDLRGAGGGVAELRIDCGPGYRVCFARQGRTVVILFAGGDKSTQRRDIDRARTVLRCLEGGSR